MKIIGILIVACLLLSGCVGDPGYVSPYLSEGAELQMVKGWAATYVINKLPAGWEFEVSDQAERVEGFYKIFVSMSQVPKKPWETIDACAYLWFNELGNLAHVSNRSMR